MTLAVAACAGAPDAGDISGAPKAADIRALRWIAPGADKVKALTMRPASCAEVPPADSPDVARTELSNRERYDIGRLAFSSSALLGGAAGRMGLSCSSCHLNGRDNPDFFLEGVSDAPGRADVTSSLLSKVQGDGAFNPTPIPDIARKDGKQIKDRLSPEFREKAHALVVKEFDGQEPPKLVLDALISFMNAQDISMCADPLARLPVTAGNDIASVSDAMALAAKLEDLEEGAAAQLMGRVARETLGRLDERFVAADQANVREALVAASRAIETWLKDASPKPGVSQRGARDTRFGLVVKAIDTARSLILREEARSLYNPSVLRAALANSAEANKPAH